MLISPTNNFGEADMLQVCRHDFFRALLFRQIGTKEEVVQHMRLLRSRMDPNAPCVLVDLNLPDGTEYLSGRWHYGTDRLEVALRNFFGAEFHGMRMVAAVVAPDHVRLLCCRCWAFRRQKRMNPSQALSASIRWEPWIRRAPIWIWSFA